MDFSEAIKLICDAKKLTRGEWGDKRHYVLLLDYILTIHKAGEAEEVTHPWIISEADMVADDWIEI